MPIALHPTHPAHPLHCRALPLFLSEVGTANFPFSPAVVLPEQFHHCLPAGIDTTRGVRALMCAVLEDALGCFEKKFVTSGRRAQRLAREAEEWFFTDDFQWPFSFVNICAALGIDPEYLRCGLKRWHQRRSPAPQRKRQSVVPARRPLKIAA